MHIEKQILQIWLTNSLRVIRMYDWLLDLYVLDFYVDNHWEKLPESWRQCLEDVSPTDLGNIILGNPTKHLLPLSLTALLKSVSIFSIPRKNTENIPDSTSDNKTKTSGNHPKLKNLFLKHVKLKKRHEISLMAEVVHKVAEESGCHSVIDFGSGLGHLLRMLAYNYEMSVAGIECQEQLTEEARKHDKELEYSARKHLTKVEMERLQLPLHLNMKLTSEEQLLNMSLPETFKSHGLVGLHPCGDLGPLLLRLFANNTQVKFICVVGCCHMKLTESGYPMSDYLKSLDHKLSYTSREISCHAIEVYSDRLLRGQYEDLKVHAYRAALERALRVADSALRHAPVGSIRHTRGMTFDSYCTLALSRLRPAAAAAWAAAAAGPARAAALAAAGAALPRWRRVLATYSLRLALAPLVETVVLLDRLMFLAERGLSSEIRAVFDPALSPRNHIIIGRRG